MHVLKPSQSFHPAEDRFFFLKAVSNMCKSLRLVMLHLNSGPVTQPAKLISKGPLFSASSEKVGFMSADVFK